MSEAEHTPGPWLIDYAETGVRWPIIVVPDETYEDGRHEIAQVNDHVAKNVGTSIKPRWRKHPECDEAMANANLIAAAPDLLDMCRETLKSLIEWGDGEGETADGLRAAIAKAEGLTPPGVA